MTKLLNQVLTILVAMAAAALALWGLYRLFSIDGYALFVFPGENDGYSVSIGALLALGALALALLQGAIFLARFALGRVSWTFDFWRASRRRAGLSALAKALVAIEEGDGKAAMAAAAKAERLLDNPDLTRLVNAKAAELAGAELRAERYYEAMALDPETEFLGVRGLLRRALIEKKPARALKLAEKAHALRPREGETLDTLLALQRRKGDWEGARKSIDAQVRAGRLTRDGGDRRKAVLLLSDAMAREQAGESDAAARSASAAAKLAPGLAPAAAMSARLAMAKGERRRAGRTLIAAWRQDPHPEVAAAFAALDPLESPEARLNRFEKLFAENPRAVETKLLEAELAIAAGKLVRAREAVEAALSAGPSARAYALMAAVENAEGAPEASVRGWLAKAAASPRGAHWVCEACGAAAARWAHACPSCDAFDRLAWRTVEDEGASGLSEALLTPLLAAPRPNGADHRAPADAAELVEPSAAAGSAQPGADSAPSASPARARPADPALPAPARSGTFAPPENAA